MFAELEKAFLPPPLTQESVSRWLVRAAIDAGFFFEGEYSSRNGDKNVIVSKVQAATKRQGKIFLRVSLSPDLEITSELMTGWDKLTRSRTSTSGEQHHYPLVAGEGLRFFSVNLPDELSLVCLQQGKTNRYIGGMSPSAQKVPWWDLDSWPFFFQPDDSLYHWRLTSLTPFDSIYFLCPLLGVPYLKSANPYSQARDFIKGLILFNEMGGSAGRTSARIISAAAEGMAFGDRIKSFDGLEEYAVIAPGPGGLGVRVK